MRVGGKKFGLLTGVALSVLAMVSAPVSMAAEKRSLDDMTEKEKEQYLYIRILRT